MSSREVANCLNGDSLVPNGLADRGAVFRDSHQGLQQALKEAVKTITEMPAHTYLTYPNGSQILKAIRTSPLSKLTELLIDTTYLASFGQLLIPKIIWLALLRFDAEMNKHCLPSEFG